MNKVINAFLRKEPLKEDNIWTNGEKFYVDDTCVAQWHGYRVLINSTVYQIKELDDTITALLKMVNKSWIVYCECNKPVPPSTGDLTEYK